MTPSRASVSAYLFGPFRLKVKDRILEREGVRVQLTPKIVDTLLVLVESAQEVVTKEDLMKAVWPDVTVVESGLTRNISVLRKALEEDVPEGTYIETIPRRGYRFVASVTEERITALEEPEPSAVENVPSDVVQVPPARRRYWAAAGIVVVGVLILLSVRPLRPRVERVPEPRVRIGEHLLYKLAPGQSARAVQEFEQAISSTPNSAAAHAGLSIALLQGSLLGVTALSEVAGRAEAEAEKALNLDPTLSTAHQADGYVSLLRHWHLGRSEKSFLRALELDPSSVQARLGYTQLKFTTGEVADAVRINEEALQLDPASPILGARYCQAFYYARDFHRAAAECRKVIDREPHYALALYYLALSLGFLGQTAQARQFLVQAEMSPGVLEVDNAWLSLRDGDRRPALAALERRRELVSRGKLNASANLLLLAMLGLMDPAYEALGAALESHAVELLTLHVDPRLDPLRSDKRYPGVLRQAGLTPRPSLSSTY